MTARVRIGTKTATDPVNSCASPEFSSKEIYELLAAALKRGVQVEIVADWHKNHKRSCLAQKIKKLGANVLLYTAGDDRKLHAKLYVLRLYCRKAVNSRLHKLFSSVIIDGKEVLTGSFNWSNSGMKKNLELAVTIRDPVNVLPFVKTFQYVHNRAHAQSLQN